MVSTHQAVFILCRPSTCQEFGLRVHFQNISSCGAEVEKGIIMGHLGSREKKKPQYLGLLSDAPGQGWCELPLKPHEDLQRCTWLLLFPQTQG